VFHFNKKHLEDETIPMWVIKTHGESFYVNHVSADIAWSTKETPNNSHTKGSIKFKECLLTIDPENNASISALSVFDKIRLRNQKLGISRIIFSWGSKMHTALAKNEFKHSPFKPVEGACGSSFIICDLLKKEEATFAALKYPNGFRILKPNETYYQAYDKKGIIWEDSDIDIYEE
jgi:hypothetical protein